VAEPTFFPSAAKWREWLQRNHNTAVEKVGGFHKAGSGRKGITYKEALD
jgi:hypothetical protein